ncbi:hypothetical protein ACHHYP_02189 [Achlya hypogyna]|uniref:Uncharacterized protein n=1 Tax=Achlya hypogyna TaxID=1202772 RepID=A0A1V9Z799_ACHHY|nr:hypothetical protein ACHHYP_02189 [Achlya hypogyna]
MTLDELYILEHALRVAPGRPSLLASLWALLRPTSAPCIDVFSEEFALFSSKRTFRPARVVLDQPLHRLMNGKRVMALRHIRSVIPIHAPGQHPEWRVLVQDDVELETWTLGFVAESSLRAWLSELTQVLAATHCHDCHVRDVVPLTPQ